MMDEENKTPLTDALWDEMNVLLFYATQGRLTEKQVRHVANVFKDFAAQLEARVYALEVEVNELKQRLDE